MHLDVPRCPLLSSKLTCDFEKLTAKVAFSLGCPFWPRDRFESRWGRKLLKLLMFFSKPNVLESRVCCFEDRSSLFSRPERHLANTKTIAVHPPVGESLPRFRRQLGFDFLDGRQTSPQALRQVLDDASLPLGHADRLLNVA
jgi:hypothetical protein